MRAGVRGSCTALATALWCITAICAPAAATRIHHAHSQPAHNDASLHEGTHAKPGEIIEGGSRHMQAHPKQPGAQTAMSNWLPAWWSSELSHWQEFPSAAFNEAAPYHGQDWEDQYAYEFFFHGKKHGTYLEMGGYDGLTFTNTLYLNEAHGWRGMLIEASPQQYYRMIGNRKDDIGLLVAACDTYQDVHFVDTGTTAGIVEFMSESFKSQWHKNMSTSETVVLIPCMPLSAILAKFGVHQLDFWSLDVEGGEYQVLQTFDFDAVRINVICLEADGHAPAKDEQVVKFLQSKGYHYYGHVDRNDWFTHPDFKPSKSPHAEAHRQEFQIIQKENWERYLKSQEAKDLLSKPVR